MAGCSIFNQCHAVTTKPVEPVSNMFHVHIDRPNEEVSSIFFEIMEETGIGLTGNLKVVSESSCYYEVSLGDQYSIIPKEQVRNVVDKLNERLRADR